MARIQHPEWRRDGFGRQRQLWLAPEVQDVVEQLEALDPALALYLEEVPGPERSRWVLERLGSDGEYHRVLQSKPGADLRALPTILMMTDTWRPGYDPVQEMIEHNERRHEELRQQQNERLAEALERVAWGWDKDTHGGVHEGVQLRSVGAWARRALARSR